MYPDYVYMYPDYVYMYMYPDYVYMYPDYVYMGTCSCIRTWSRTCIPAFDRDAATMKAMVAPSLRASLL